jgi:hypothetical protein
MMRPATRVIWVLLVPCAIWSASLCAQTSEDKKNADSPTTPVPPVKVDLLSLQVSKLPRDDFGHGIKPGTNETIAFWLANSGTAVDLRIKLDRQIARFDEQASRLIRFADDKGGDLTRPPDGRPINSFFNENKPIIVKPGLGADEAEVILRGFGTPAPGATKLQIHADLVFLAGTDERIAERKGLEPTPGTEATIGPLHIRFKDPRQAVEEAEAARAPAGAPPLFNRLVKDLRQAGPPAGRLSPPGGARESVRYAFDYDPLERPIKSLACLNPRGKQVVAVEGRFLNGEQGGTVLLPVPEMPSVHLRVVYFEKSGVITVPIRLETGVGF